MGSNTTVRILDFRIVDVSVDSRWLVPSILLASIAMQESTCNPNTVGGAGEQGLMQITPDKCHGAPKGNCKDIVSFLMHQFASDFVHHGPGL